MSPEELKNLLQRRPFMPFRIHVAEIASYEVRRPDMVWIGRTILFLGLVREIESEFFDEPVLIALRHITRIEPIVEGAATA